LLGENRIIENDEKLTDLTTVFFGLRIFNANAAFQTYRGVDYSGWRKENGLFNPNGMRTMRYPYWHIFVVKKTRLDWYLTLNIKE
jgi:hypothetical protein